MSSTAEYEELAKKCVQRQPDIVGRSKKLWLLDGDTCVIELIPSLRSYTYAREEDIEGTAELRLDFYELAAAWLADGGVPTTFLGRWGSTRYFSRYVPSPPFEVIVKNVANGSTTKKYPGLFREGHRFTSPVIKFDYRTDPEDEPIGEGYLHELGIPVEQFRQLALRCNDLLTEHLTPLDLWDFCLIIGVDSSAPSIISEISPDCMRLKGSDGTALDKDLFRQGADPDEILESWRDLLARVR